MKYPYKPHQIDEILRLQKCLPEGEELGLEKTSPRSIGRHFESRPQLVDGPFVDMRYLGKAPELNNPETYDASFLLANQRVRGVGYNPIGRHRLRFKQKIAQGWHLNVCDPNRPTNDPAQNMHHPLPDFTTTDFRDFINQTASMWRIDLGWDRQKGLL